jgi:hypothetical protein
VVVARRLRRLCIFIIHGIFIYSGGDDEMARGT